MLDVVKKSQRLSVESKVFECLRSGSHGSVCPVLNQWRFVQDKTFDNSLGFMTPEDGRAEWQAPAFDRVKVNTDAALFDNLNRYSHAQVVRDHNGSLVEAMSKCFQGSVTGRSNGDSRSP